MAKYYARSILVVGPPGTSSAKICYRRRLGAIVFALLKGQLSLPSIRPRRLIERYAPMSAIPAHRPIKWRGGLVPNKSTAVEGRNETMVAAAEILIA